MLLNLYTYKVQLGISGVVDMHNGITVSSGSIVPDSLRNFSVSEWISLIT